MNQVTGLSGFESARSRSNAKVHLHSYSGDTTRAADGATINLVTGQTGEYFAPFQNNTRVKKAAAHEPCSSWLHWTNSRRASATAIHQCNYIQR